MKRALLLAAVALAGCTTVSNGPLQRVQVDSDPAGARVEVRRCGAMATKSVTTPGSVWVSRRSTQCELVLRMPYYETGRVRLARHVARNMDRYSDAANIILNSDTTDSFSDSLFFTGFVLIPSFAVDAASGAMFELQPDKVFVKLTPATEEWRDNPVRE